MKYKLWGITHPKRYECSSCHQFWDFKFTIRQKSKLHRAPEPFLGVSSMSLTSKFGMYSIYEVHPKSILLHIDSWS